MESGRRLCHFARNRSDFWFAAISESQSEPTLLEIALIFGLSRFPSREVNPLCLKSLWRGCGELREDVDEDRAESWSKAQ
jgi:hypothetical protein